MEDLNFTVICGPDRLSRHANGKVTEPVAVEVTRGNRGAKLGERLRFATVYAGIKDKFVPGRTLGCSVQHVCAPAALSAANVLAWRANGQVGMTVAVEIEGIAVRTRSWTGSHKSS
jgi:hypothetical protein